MGIRAHRETTNFLVTGASTGIGASSALELDRRGYRVFAGVRRQEDGERLRARASGRLTAVMLDVVDPDSIAAAAASVAQAAGPAGLAGLVNNAGISVAGPLEFIPIEDLRRQLEVNVVAQVAVTQAFLPLIRRARGRIVNMGSVCGLVATPFLAPYSMSKYALEAFTDALRRELYPWGIHVSIIEPGIIATPIWEKGFDQARTLFDRLAPQARQLYESAFTATLSATEAKRAAATPPEKVARAVRHALTARWPRTRYLVGRSARGAARGAWLFPDRLFDRITRRHVGLRD